MTNELSPDEIRAAVERITASAGFVRSERLARFLRYVVGATLAGRAGELKEYSIGVEVYDKGPDFDPRLDSAVRVDARRLRSRLGEYYTGEGTADPVRISLPKGGYAPEIHRALQAPPQPAGPASVPVGGGRFRRRTALVALIAAALAIGIYWVRVESRPPSTVDSTVRAVAVLPFVNMTGRQGNEPLCDGLATELIDRLSRIPGLKVVPRASSFRYKTTRPAIRAIATDLSVDSVIEGTLRGGEDRLRITVQLIRGVDGSHLWSESFDLERSDELTLQTAIGQAIEQRIGANLPADVGHKIRLGPEEGEISRLFAQADHLIQRRTAVSLERARKYAEQGIQLRPDYARGHATLADCYHALADRSAGQAAAELSGKARRHAERAIALDPRLAAPHAVLANLKLDQDWAWREAEELFRRALALNPNNSYAAARYSRLLSLSGRHQEAIEHAHRAEAISPLSVLASAALGQACFYARRYEEAIQHLRDAMEVDPGYVRGHTTIARSLALLGRRQEAWDVVSGPATSTESSAESAAVRAWMLAREGRYELARREAVEATGSALISEVGVYAELGDSDRVFRLLEQAVLRRDPAVLYMKVTPSLDRVRGDPRLEALCAKAGLSGCATTGQAIGQAAERPRQQPR